MKNATFPYLRSLPRDQFQALRSLGRLYAKGGSFSNMDSIVPAVKIVRKARIMDRLGDMEVFVKTRRPVRTPRQIRIAYLAGRHSGPVFYINEGCDCDGVEFGLAVSFTSRLEADEFIRKDAQWADGPSQWRSVTEAEYRAFKGWSRDRFAEAAGY